MDFAILIIVFLLISICADLNKIKKSIGVNQAAVNGVDISELRAKENAQIKDILNQQIGSQIIVSFYEDEEPDNFAVFEQVTLLEVQDGWVKVRQESKKHPCDILLRTSGIKSITMK